MGYETLTFEVRDGVGHLTLNRPKAANALNLEMAQELLQVAKRCDEDAGVRAVLLTGAGRMFCAGGDLRSFARRPTKGSRRSSRSSRAPSTRRSRSSRAWTRRSSPP